jgi:hypothetical protein
MTMLERRSLSMAQRDVIDNDNVAWVGWDQKDRPVVHAWYFRASIQSLDPARRAPGSVLKQWAITRRGDAINVTYPQLEPL